MKDFEFVFALYGLLLGLSLTEVLGGLARSIEARLRPGTAMRIGWLTPLMAAFLLLDLLSFWGSAWLVRDQVVVSNHALLAVTAFASAYYLAATLAFPREPAALADLDDHFFRVRRLVIGAMLVLLFCQIGWYLTLPDLAARLMRPWALSMTAILAVLMALALVVRGERASRVAMLALVARYVILYLL